MVLPREKYSKDRVLILNARGQIRESMTRYEFDRRPELLGKALVHVAPTGQYTYCHSIECEDIVRGKDVEPWPACICAVRLFRRKS